MHQKPEKLVTAAKAKKLYLKVWLVGYNNYSYSHLQGFGEQRDFNLGVLPVLAVVGVLALGIKVIPGTIVVPSRYASVLGSKLRKRAAVFIHTTPLFQSFSG